MLVVISYDISDDKRRDAAAERLLGWGERVQESVFECWLTEGELRRLIRQLEAMIDERTDRLRCYRLCRKDIAGIRCQGAARPPADWALRII